MATLMTARVLVVDDDRNMVDLLRFGLSEAGYAASAAFSGEEALKMARQLRPDLIVLDLMLPGMNGFSVCETLRSDPATASIPIVMITGLPGALPRLAGLEMGAEAYLNKPFQVSDLISRIDQVLGRAGSVQSRPLRDETEPLGIQTASSETPPASSASASQ